MEEAGLAVDPAGFVWFAHWTPGRARAPGASPPGSSWRRAAEGAVTVDDGEIHEHQWIRPADAIAPARRGRDRAHPADLDDVAACSPSTPIRRRRPAPRARAREPADLRHPHRAGRRRHRLDVAGRRRATTTATPSKPGPRQPPADARRRLAGRDLLTRTDAPVRCPDPAAGRVVSRVPAATATRFASPSTRPRFRRWLDSSDLSWARRLVVVVTGVALARGRVQRRRRLRPGADDHHRARSPTGATAAPTATAATDDHAEEDRHHPRACRACPTRRTSTARPRPAS